MISYVAEMKYWLFVCLRENTQMRHKVSQYAYLCLKTLHSQHCFFISFIFFFDVITASILLT